MQIVLLQLTTDRYEALHGPSVTAELIVCNGRKAKQSKSSWILERKWRNRSKDVK